MSRRVVTGKLAAVVRERRQARGLAQEELAAQLEVWEVPSPSATPPEQLGLNERIRAALAVMVEDEVGSYLGEGRSSSLRAERKRASES